MSIRLGQTQVSAEYGYVQVGTRQLLVTILPPDALLPLGDAERWTAWVVREKVGTFVDRASAIEGAERHVRLTYA